MQTKPLIKHKAGDPVLEQVLALIRQSFAYMESRIDPPSSILRSTVQDLSDLCARGEVWSLGSPPQACVCLTLGDNTLSLGRLAVAEDQRGLGLGKAMLNLAEQRAAHYDLESLELMVRVELTENIQFYQHWGFELKEQGTHDGYDKPTYWVMRKPCG